MSQSGTPLPVLRMRLQPPLGYDATRNPAEVLSSMSKPIMDTGSCLCSGGVGGVGGVNEIGHWSIIIVGALSHVLQTVNAFLRVDSACSSFHLCARLMQLERFLHTQGDMLLLPVRPKPYTPKP